MIYSVSNVGVPGVLYRSSCLYTPPTFWDFVSLSNARYFVMEVTHAIGLIKPVSLNDIQFALVWPSFLSKASGTVPLVKQHNCGNHLQLNKLHGSLENLSIWAFIQFQMIQNLQWDNSSSLQIFLQWLKWTVVKGGLRVDCVSHHHHCNTLHVWNVIFCGVAVNGVSLLWIRQNRFIYTSLKVTNSLPAWNYTRPVCMAMGSVTAARWDRGNLIQHCWAPDVQKKGDTTRSTVVSPAAVVRHTPESTL